MRAIRCVLGVVLVLGAAASGALADGAQDAFNARFGDECARAAASRGATDDVLLAERLLAAATAEGTDPALAVLLCGKAAEFGSKHASGYATTAAALDLLAERDPASRPDWLLKAADIRQKAFDAQKGPGRAVAGDDLVNALLDAADAQARAQAWPVANALCRRALAADRAAGLERQKEILGVQNRVATRQRVEKRVADLGARLAANAADAAARAEVVRLCVMELDDPARAATYVDASCPEDTRKYVPAAAKGVDAAPELACLPLAEWYLAMATGAGPAAREAVFGRAWAYANRFVRLHAAADAPRARAAALMRKSEDGLAALGATGPVIGGALVMPGRWVDLLRRVDPKADAAKGEWAVDGGGLAGKEFALFSLPVIPEGSYEVSMRFIRTSGESDVAILLPLGPTGVAFALSRDGGGHSQLTAVTEGEDRVKPGKLVNGTPYVLDVGVELLGARAAVDVRLDGAPYFAWSGPIAATGTEEQYRLPDVRHLGLQLHAAKARFEYIKLRMTSGHACLTR